MDWKIIGHEQATTILREEIREGQPSHAYLFAGPAHVGKLLTARTVAGALLCEKDDAPCGECGGCLLYTAGNHPDYYELPEADPLKIDHVRKLKRELSMTPHLGEWKIGCIPNAERLGIPAQNALLKLLEEPPAHTVIILTAAAPEELLATTGSRCRLVRFAIPGAEAADELTKLTSKEALELSGGRPGLAVTLAETPNQMALIKERRDLLVQVVAANAAERLRIAKDLSAAEDLLDTLDDWQWLHQQALRAEQGITDPTVRVLAERYTSTQLRLNLKALLAAREALHYNSNVLLATENALLKLGT